jgi:hypothetical protein
VLFDACETSCGCCDCQVVIGGGGGGRGGRVWGEGGSEPVRECISERAREGVRKGILRALQSFKGVAIRELGRWLRSPLAAAAPDLRAAAQVAPGRFHAPLYVHFI